MTLMLLFWILMLIWLFLGTWITYSSNSWIQVGPNLLLFFIILCLGWQVFGAPIK